MLSRLIAAPLVIGLALALYFSWESNGEYALYIVPFIIGLVIIYMFSPQIDWYYYKNNPPKLDEQMQLLLTKNFDFYKHLAADEKKRFRDRMSLYMLANEFMPAPGMEGVATDVKGFIAASLVQLTFGLEDYRLTKFEHIITYPKPFPSPQYPENFHTSEIFEEDGVIMFSIRQLMQGIFEKSHYHIGLHEYANAFINSYQLDYPQMTADIWEKLEAISGFSKTAIHDYINLPEIDPLAVSIHHFFRFPEQMKIQMPKTYDRLTQIFNQDPTQKEHPVINKSEKLLVTN